MVEKPRPIIDETNAPFFEGASRHQLVLQRCSACGLWIFFPRVACPHCLSESVHWTEASGRGELVSYCIVYRPHHPAFYDEVPIYFGAIKLAEGPTMLSEIRAESEKELFIGAPMTVDFAEVAKGLTLPVWKPDPR